MRGIAVLDMSSIIWDIGHFEQNKHSYFKLMEVLPTLYNTIIDNGIPIVFRSELVSEVQSYFPYEQIPGEYFDYQISTLHFLTQVKFDVYPSKDDQSIKTKPPFVKPYFSPSTQNEMRYMISYIYTQVNATKGILSFKHLWGAPYSLTLESDDVVKVKVDLCDDPSVHKEILSKFKKVFEHNPKHNKYKSSPHAFHGEKISKLSCYNERKGDTTAAQYLLDRAVELNNHYYAYDMTNKTYVKFVKTRKNIFHGYDVVPAAPDLISLRAIFNK